jgi:putative Mg2+ transporter-C (MgtC) family protein
MPDTETILMRLLLALVLGGIIGLEREYRDKSAGFRTLTLISIGSCLFTIVSYMITSGTNDRIASNIVTGIGFLGAGVIFKSEKGVNGLTTAASIWAVAAIGMAAASGFYIMSIVTCFAILIILVAFNPIETWLDRVNKERTYRLVMTFEPGVLEKFQAIMQDCGLQHRPVKRMRTGDKLQLLWKVRGKRKSHDCFVELILKDKEITEFEF